MAKAEETLKLDDEGNLYDDTALTPAKAGVEIDEPSPIPATPPLPIQSPVQYRSIILQAYEGDLLNLENLIEKFLNSEPRKEIVNISFSALGVKFYVLIVYKEGI